jgi:hypothetical protein
MTATALATLGDAYCHLGRYEDGRACLLEAMEFFAEMRPDGEENLASSYRSRPGLPGWIGLSEPS